MPSGRPESQSKRPVLHLPLSRGEIVLIIVAVAGVVANIVPVAQAWTAMPAIVPTHFGINGKPNAYGPKALLLLTPTIVLVMTVVFLVLARYPHLFNYPVRITQENAARQYRRGRLLLRWANVALAWVCAFMEWLAVEAALGQTAGMETWSLPLAIGLLVFVPLGLVALIIVWAIGGR